ncbi:hypothetical protein SNE40_009563 [Patella caerulea]|uniref:Uncharacterized protein n=1 Tax=Patella caerulea TaxID=87958 RepID=A0AAN8JSF5_PATCE
MAETKAENNFEAEYNRFIETGSENNATFQLHLEMMHHCDEIFALSLSERLGGMDGYQLMLASVKSSLRFAFLNGASSYASYCTQLLHHHYQAGKFYTQFKWAFYSTPHKGSDVNFGLDTQREMEHRDVLKSFRSGGTLSSVLPRMSLVDSLQPIQSFDKEVSDRTSDDILGLTLNQTDLNYVLRVTKLVLRRGGLSVHADNIVRNVYRARETYISPSMLDKHTQEIGRFLIVKHISSLSLFGHSKDTLPEIDTVNRPKELLSRLKNRLPGNETYAHTAARSSGQSTRVVTY